MIVRLLDRSLVVRPCATRDVARVLAFWKTYAGPTAIEVQTTQAVRKRLQRDRQLFLLAWDGPVLVGSIMGGWDGWRGSIARIAVHRDYRRAGLARLLVKHVEKELRRLGAKRIGCVVFRNNTPARAFWENAGYSFDSAVVRHVKNL